MSAVLCVIGVNLFTLLTNPGEQETIIVCALYSIVLILQVFEMINYWFQAKLMAKYSSIIGLLGFCAGSGFRVYLLITRKSIYWFPWVSSLAALVVAGALLWTYHRKGTQKLSFSRERGKKLLAQSRYYIISDLMVVIFAQTDRIMLKSFLGNEATGYYSAAFTCAGLTGFVFSAIIDSLRPSILEKDLPKETYQRRISELFSILIYLALAQSLGMTLFAPIIIGLIYGAQYSAAVPALQIVVWYTTFAYMGSARNIWLLAEGKQKHLWKINLVGAAANVVLNALLIPMMGVNGAALASLATQFLTNVVTGWIYRPIRGINGIILEGLKPKTFIRIAGKMIGELRQRGLKRQAG